MAFKKGDRVKIKKANLAEYSDLRVKSGKVTRVMGGGSAVKVAFDGVPERWIEPAHLETK